VPEVECIGKGKANARYEFGLKASIVTTNARAPCGQFVLHAKALPGKPRHVKTFTAFLGRSPDTATAEDLRRFQLHQRRTGVRPPTRQNDNVAT
jgi:hypothetical protein